ncbi:permease [Ovoidimarina sediminis]|uniref:permease n=1 Tax=Ovoidimarina sediminis TaxID=3079856 RepID=UPI002911BD56|nr:permease [Rhodophyticola sp. MJ-SS7]MDU8944763.1 permease [Rhodophyticola sp. MJ-SS7]
MADLSTPRSMPSLWNRIDRIWLLVAAVPVVIALIDPTAAWPIASGAIGALVHTAPFILFAVAAIGYLKATGAESLLARAFQGREARMVVLAALAGGLSPFCSCEVIPFIAALLAAGTPLSAVMAFWLSSPLMDPAMFAITAGGIGTGFAIGKTIAAVALGLFGGFAVMAMKANPVFADPLRPVENRGCGCGPSPFKGAPVWRFWNDPARRATFFEAARSNLIFLGKWLALAYLLEGLMIRYIPADLIGGILGGSGPGPVILAGLVGAPAYLNGYAAVPLVAGLMEQGMSPGAAMAFVLAGGVSCIPAAVAVWALVKPRVFAAYLGLALTGAIVAGLLWNALNF